MTGSKNAVALLSGILFGAGLATSGMTNPQKVLSFLDVSGRWDPSLAFVMGAALIVSTLGYAVARRRQTSFLGEAFDLPTSTTIDARLLVGSALFGVGWGMAGLCPGPAIAAAVTGQIPVWIFLAAMAAGAGAYRLAEAARSDR